MMMLAEPLGVLNLLPKTKRERNKTGRVEIVSLWGVDWDELRAFLVCAAAPRASARALLTAARSPAAARSRRTRRRACQRRSRLKLFPR